MGWWYQYGQIVVKWLRPQSFVVVSVLGLQALVTHV